MALNVNRNVEDVFYRYKMPRLVAKVEGKGNGIKTVVANMTEIAKALNRPPAYPTKYFGCELGAQTQFDLKNERYIVNGEHDAGKLQDTLDGFIKRYVLCQNCENPETTLKVRKGNTIQQTCKACGHVGWIDMKHKLTAFILKNPPPEDTADSAAGRKKEENDDEDAVDAKAVNGHANGHNEVDQDDEEWVPVQLDEAQKKEALAGALGKLVVTDDLELSTEERIDKFYEWLQKYKAQSNYIAKAKEVVDEAIRLDVKEKASLLLVGTFISPEDPCGDIAKHRPILLRFTQDNRRAQKYLMGGIEQLIAKHKATLLPKTTHILKALYDEDIIEEEQLLEWGKKASKKYVARAESQAIIDAAVPLLKWLKEAEEESSEDEAEVEFTNKEKSGVVTTKPAQAKDKESDESKDDSDDKDDLNIDDI